MKDKVKLLLVACASATLVALTAPNSSLAATAERGKAAYIQNGCWQCHGTVGQGSIMTSGGKRLAPEPMPWEAFLSFVRSTNRTMPPYSEMILSDGDLADIYAYLQSIPKPSGREQPAASQALAIVPVLVNAGEADNRFDHGARVRLAFARDIMCAAVRHR